MSAPIGNQNAAKGKRWSAAIERALERRATGERPPEDTSDLIKGLDAAADLFVSQLFDSKDLGCFKELGDRIDGRAPQTIDATVKGSLTSVLASLGSAVRSPSDDS